MRSALLVALIVGFLAAVSPEPAPVRAASPRAYTTVARITSYLPTGSVTYSGQWPYPGSAACSWNYPLYSRVTFSDGREVVCIDRGLLGWSGWIDLYVTNWDAVYYLRQLYGDWQEVIIEEP